MGATWLYEHKQFPKISCLKLLVRFWNNLTEMFLEWPFSELFLKFWSVDKHGISEWRLLALYRRKEILVNSSLKTTRKKWLEQSQKIRWAIQGHLGPLVLIYSLYWSLMKVSHIVMEYFWSCLLLILYKWKKNQTSKLIACANNMKCLSENATKQHFLIFAECFHKLPYMSLKLRIVW